MQRLRATIAENFQAAVHSGAENTQSHVLSRRVRRSPQNGQTVLHLRPLLLSKWS